MAKFSRIVRKVLKVVSVPSTASAQRLVLFGGKHKIKFRRLDRGIA
jgi:hypothetical protein